MTWAGRLAAADPGLGRDSSAGETTDVVERPDAIAAKHVAADFVFIDRGLSQLAEIAGLDVQDVDPVNPN